MNLITYTHWMATFMTTFTLDGNFKRIKIIKDFESFTFKLSYFRFIGFWQNNPVFTGFINTTTSSWQRTACNKQPAAFDESL